MAQRPDPAHPVARRFAFPRSSTAAASVAGGVGAYALTELTSGPMLRVLMFLLVTALGTLVPSLRLTDPATRAPLSADSSVSSVVLSLASAVAAALASGDLPLPDSARGLLMALLAALTGTHVPSVLGSALGRPRRTRAEVRDRLTG